MLKTHTTQRLLGFILAFCLMLLVTLGMTMRGSALRGQVADENVIDTASGATNSGDDELTLTERRALRMQSSASSESVSSEEAASSVSADSFASSEWTASSSSESAVESAASSVSSELSSSAESSASSSTESSSSESSALSSTESSSSSSDESSLSSVSDATGGSLLIDTVLGQPANIFPAFLIPDTADFSNSNDVQDRVILTLTDNAGLEQQVYETVTEIDGFYRITLSPPSTFRPGKYRFQATLNRTQGISASLANFFRTVTGQDPEKDLLLVDMYFDWGTMAVNVDSNSYASGNSVLVSAALVTNDGLPLCVDTLTASFNVSGKNTLKPFCSGSGETLTLQAPTGTSAVLTVDGSDTDVSRIMTQLIPLDSDPQIQVKRESVTRTNGGRTEQMNIRVQTRETIVGTLTESVPAGFEVTNVQPVPTNMITNVDGTFITWDGQWQAGAGRQFSYDYKTPEDTPVFGLFGPLKMKGQMDVPVFVAQSSSASSDTSSSSEASDLSDASSASSESGASSSDADASASVASTATSSLTSLSSNVSLIEQSSSASSDTSATSTTSLEPADSSETGSSEPSQTGPSEAVGPTSSAGNVDSADTEETVSWMSHFLGALLGSLIIDDQNVVSFEEDRQWQLLSVSGDSDFTSAERARRLTLERGKAVFAANASPSFKLVDTQLDETDARLLDADENMRADIAYEEILHSVVEQEDVSNALETNTAQTSDDREIIEEVITQAESLETGASDTAETKDKLITALATEAATKPETSSVLTLTLTGPNGMVINPAYHFEVGSVELVLDPIRDFTPGLYTLVVTITNPITGEIQTLTQQFAWGVLAMNPNKDIYKEGDTAHIHFGALDDHGEIVCDAILALHVVAPDGSVTDLSTEDDSIVTTGTCGLKQPGFIGPDFTAELPLTQSGAYHLTLNGTINGATRSITGIVIVKDDAPFILSRSGATRLWPFADSPMDITVQFNTAIDGQVVETLPAGFEVKDTQPEATVTQDADGTSRIVWEGTWEEGETALFHYTYKAPEISPHFYLLGPVLIQSNQPFAGAHLTSTGSILD